MCQSKKLGGFTLIEIIVTLFILMTVGIMICAGLNTIVRAEEHMESQSKELASLQLAITKIENDFKQINSSSILNADGLKQPRFILTDSSVEFTRSGAVRSTVLNNNKLQRVTYKQIGNYLIRSTSPIYNKISGSNVSNQILLHHIQFFHCHLIPSNNPLLDTPIENKTNIENTDLAMGIVVEIQTAELGYIKRVILFAINTMDSEPDAPI